VLILTVEAVHDRLLLLSWIAGAGNRTASPFRKEVKMRQVLTDNSGLEWYVESDRPISVKGCPACGKPIVVQSLELKPEVTHIRFCDKDGKYLGVFDTEAFPTAWGKELSLYPVCQFCGYDKMK
jgi:hypothetical protein